MAAAAAPARSCPIAPLRCADRRTGPIWELGSYHDGVLNGGVGAPRCGCLWGRELLRDPRPMKRQRTERAAGRGFGKPRAFLGVFKEEAYMCYSGTGGCVALRGELIKEKLRCICCIWASAKQDSAETGDPPA